MGWGIVFDVSEAGHGDPLWWGMRDEGFREEVFRPRNPHKNSKGLWINVSCVVRQHLD